MLFVNLKDICQLHALLLPGHAERGKLRTKTSWLDRVPFEPVDAQLVPDEMDKLIKLLHNGVAQVQQGHQKGMQGMHPIELAALVHYFFVSE